MDILVYILDALVLVALVAALLFFTKALKSKEDPSARKKHMSKAGIALVAYAALNMLRLYAEGQLF